jgi:hypothetical protein
MRLSEQDYAATLLAAGRVLVTKFNKVGCSVNEWEKFLADGVIPNYNPVQRASNCVEATFSKVNSNIFVPDPNQKSIKVVLLRIGKNADGEVSIASTMHNDDCEPPKRQSLWSAHSDLNTALSPSIKETISNNNTRLNAVMKWVDMEHLQRIDVPDEGHDNPSPEPTLTTETTAKETDGTNEEGLSDRHLYPCLAKYGLLDIINCSGDKAEVLRREAKMNGILNDIMQYKNANDTSVRISAWSKGVHSELVEVKPCKKGDDFYKLAVRTGWIDAILTKCIDQSNDDNDAAYSVIDYLLCCHKSKSRHALGKAGVIPSILIHLKWQH